MGLAEAAAPSNEPEPHVDRLRHVNLFSTATGSLRQAMKPIRSRQLFYHVLHASAHANVQQTPQTRPRSSSDQHTRTTQGRARALRRQLNSSVQPPSCSRSQQQTSSGRQRLCCVRRIPIIRRPGHVTGCEALRPRIPVFTDG